MDDLILEFVTDTSGLIACLDRTVAGPRFLDNARQAFATIHTGCGFLSLGRLEALTEAAVQTLSLMDQPGQVTASAMDLTFDILGRVREQLAFLEENRVEQVGSDQDLIERMQAYVSHAGVNASAAGF